MKPIVCRLDQRLWILVAASLLMSLAFIFGPSLDSKAPQNLGFIIISAFVGCVFLVGTLYIADELIRGEVRADDAGLSWVSGFSRRKSVRWDGIQDFYKTTAATVYFVVTPRGKIELNRYYVGLDAILEIVPGRAATATARAWEVRGYRPHEAWQERLPMWSKSQKRTAPTFSLVLLVCVILLIILYALDGKPDQSSRGFSSIDIFPLVMAVLFFGAQFVAVAWLFAAMWRERRFACENRAQVLHLNVEGLVFENGNDSIRARWDEIERVEPTTGPIRLRGYRVITRNGEFSLWRLSSDQNMAFQFRARGEHYAPAAFEELRAGEENKSLAAELNAAPASADGAQTFSFRTRGNRLFIGTIIAVLGLAPLLYLIVVYNNAVDEPFAPSWLLFGALCVFAIVVSSALCLWFARASIVATADELQLHSPFRSTRHIRWDDIEAAGMDIWGNWVRVNGRKIYWMRGLSPARAEEFRKLIEIY